MSSEGLEWMMDIDAKTDGPRDMLGVLDRLDATLKKLDGKLEHTGKASEHAGEGHKKHGEHAKGLTGALQRAVHQGMEPFIHKAKEIAEFEFMREATEKLLELPMELAEKVAELGKEMIKAAAAAERTEKSFSMVFGEHGAEEMLEDIDKIGKNTEFTHERLEQLTGSLGRVGLKGQGLKEARALALDIATLFGNKEEGLSSAQSAIERLMLTGEMSIKTLTGAGISKKDFFSELAMRTGKGAKQLEEEMSQGKIKTDVIMRALEGVVTRRTGKALGGATHEMSRTMGARLEHLGELPELYFQKLAKSEGFRRLSDAVGEVLEKLDPEGPLGQRIFGALNEAFDGVGKYVHEIDFKAVFEEIKEDIPQAVSALKTLADVVITIGHGFHVVRDTIAEIDYAMKGGSGNDFVHKWTPLGWLKDHGLTGFDKVMLPDRVKRDIAATVNAPGETPAAAGMSRTGAADLMTSAGEDASEGLIDGMLSKAPKVAQAGGELGKAGAGGTRESIDSHSPSRVFADIGKDTVDGFVLGVRGSKGKLENALSIMDDDLPGGGRDASPAVPMLSPRGASQISGGAPQITIAPQVTVHMGGGKSDGPAAAEAVGRAIADITVTALQSAIDSLAIQAGVS